MRTAITPGRLYWLLTREFHERRPEQCSACRMPLPELIEPDGPDAPNWSPGGMPPVCESCAPVIAEIIARHQAAYDVFDPVSRPLRRRAREQPASGPTFH
ncbi:MAG TPA: hypothetical protein VFP44_17875 [Usitatibacter sp.]|nr:hypothetical protein [Usitatibacter sp.]